MRVNGLVQNGHGDQVTTVKWPTSDPEGCAQFIRAVAQ